MALISVCLAVVPCQRPCFAGRDAPFAFAHLSADEGLSQNSVHCILQTNNGFMWFGTSSGPNRFDGYEVHKYLNVVNETAGSPAGSVYAMTEWKGHLWVGMHAHGVAWYDPSEDAFRCINSSTIISPVNSLCVDGEDRLLVATGTGLYTVGDDNMQLTCIPLPGPLGRALEGHGVSVLLRDSRNTIWAGTYHGLFRWNPADPTVVRYGRSEPERYRISSDSVRALCLDDAGELYVGTAAGLDVKSGGAERVKRNIVRGTTVTAISRDSEGLLWLGTHNDGLILVEISQGSIVGRIKRDLQRQEGLRSGSVLSLCVDSFNMVWIGTASAGVERTNVHRAALQHYRIDAKSPQHLGVWSLCTTGDIKGTEVFAGTQRGLYRFGSSMNHGLCVWRSQHAIRALQPDRKQRNDVLWVGTLGGGLVKLHRTPQGYRESARFLSNAAKNNESCIYALAQDESGTLWVGTNGSGLLSFNTESGNLVYHPMIAGSDTNRWAMTLCADRGGVIWIGSWRGGLWRVDCASGRVERGYEAPGNTISLQSETIFSISTDARNDDILWLGSNGHGLLKFDKRTGAVDALNDREGFTDNTVYGILQDTVGGLWMSTNDGVFRYNSESRQLTRYSVDAGLQGNEFNLGAYCQDSRGTVYFGGERGFDGFDTRLCSNHTPPALALSSVTCFGQKVYGLTAGCPTRPLTFSYDQQYLAFAFVALHYENPANNVYAFKIEGIDTAWSPPTRERLLKFLSLPPGDYIIRAKAANCNGVWNNAGLAIPIRIAPPFWQTSWFLVLLTMILCGTIFAAQRFRVRNILAAERARRDEQEILRQKLAADFHDELGSRAAKIVFSVNLLREDTGFGEQGATMLLPQVAQQARLLVRDMREMVWQLDPAKDSLLDLATYLKDFSDGLFDSTHIAFRLIGLTSAFEGMRLHMEWRTHLTRIFKEGMTNILKHAPECTSASLLIMLEQETLTMELTDNGPGGASLESHVGNGLANMYKRAQSLGGNLSVISPAGGGTRVRFTGKPPLRVVDPRHNKS
jgi:ligand-binding sensor domain-containing protein/signal transduction histidine kinase